MTYLAQSVSTDALINLANRSHEVIRRFQDPGGAYPASPTFSAYRGYAWLRDGAFTAEGVSRFGDTDSVERFHDWVDGVLVRRRGQVEELLASAAAGAAISPNWMLPTRFTFTGDNGSDPWWDFQTDGYGIWLWSLVAHAQRHGADLVRWRAGIEVAVDYLTAFWDLPCYDWWEEHGEQRHVSTLGAVYGGLSAITSSGVLDEARNQLAREVTEAARALVLTEGITNGHLCKWLGSDAIDASLASCVVPFGLVPVGGEVAKRTLQQVASQLDVDGGVHRFRADVFYGGGQWPLLAALLGWNLARAGDTAGAWRHLRWIAAQSTVNGELPEQVGEHLMHPDTRREWVQRWGSVATPLLWSHGMYLILADELGLLEGHQG